MLQHFERLNIAFLIAIYVFNVAGRLISMIPRFEWVYFMFDAVGWLLACWLIYENGNNVWKCYALVNFFIVILISFAPELEPYYFQAIALNWVVTMSFIAVLLHTGIDGIISMALLYLVIWNALDKFVPQLNPTIMGSFEMLYTCVVALVVYVELVLFKRKKKLPKWASKLKKFIDP